MSYVPVVDISADPGAVGRELDEICRTAGFFQVTGHGIPDEVAERAWTTATSFFDLPLEDRLGVARPAPDYPYGYIPLAGESLSQSVAGAAPPDLKEVFNVGPPARPSHPFADPGEAWACTPSLWPATLPEPGSRGPPTAPPCVASVSRADAAVGQPFGRHVRGDPVRRYPGHVELVGGGTGQQSNFTVPRRGRRLHGFLR